MNRVLGGLEIMFRIVVLAQGSARLIVLKGILTQATTSTLIRLVISGAGPVCG